STARPVSLAEPTPRSTLWEDFLHTASPAQQLELLALAGRQGLLYAHQLPTPPAANGSRSTPEEFGAAKLIGQLLAGDTSGLAPVVGEELSYVDQALDLSQREAVARALAT